VVLRFLPGKGAQTTGVNETDRARVLVVDDEPNIAELVATALRYEGFDVSTAHNGTKHLCAGRAIITTDASLPALCD